MNHLNDCFHRWHCASGSCKDSLLPCGIAIPLQGLHSLCLQISNKVSKRDPVYGSLAIGEGQVYMHHKWWWGKFKVPFLFNCCLEDHFRSPSVNLQQLKLWILLVAVTKTTMQFSAALRMGGAAITSNSKPILCSNSNSNGNNITNITNISNGANMGFVDWSTIVEGVMLVGG